MFGMASTKVGASPVPLGVAAARGCTTGPGIGPACPTRCNRQAHQPKRNLKAAIAVVATVMIVAMSVAITALAAMSVCAIVVVARAAVVVVVVTVIVVVIVIVKVLFTNLANFPVTELF